MMYKKYHLKTKQFINSDFQKLATLDQIFIEGNLINIEIVKYTSQKNTTKIYSLQSIFI